MYSDIRIVPSPSLPLITLPNFASFENRNNSQCAGLIVEPKKSRIMQNLQELLSKPVWQMTGEEFIMLSRRASGQTEAQPQPVTDTSRKYVYGILGIAKLFGCSLPTANRIKKSGKIDKAITQIGRKIIVDAELALELAGKKTGGRK